MFFTATDIANFVACRHLLTLKLEAAEGKIQKPYFHDLGVELLRELGERHEAAYFNQLASKPDCRVVSIPTDVEWTEAVGRTKEAIRDGADAIYQATFQDGNWGGRADFLIRVDKPSLLGPFSYEVVETKLAKSAKVRAILQLCFYSELLGNIQGLQPESMHVVLGGSLDRETFQVSGYIAYFRKVKRDFEQASTGPRDTYPEPVALCDVCEWFSVCNDRWHKDDHLSLVASITRIQRAEELNQARSIAAKLVEGLSPDPTKLTDEEYARWLLAQMMEWHRREEKSSWWEYFRLLDLSDHELLEDKSALGGLTYVGAVGQEKRSLIHRYKFPAQDHALDRAHDIRDPRTEKGPGEIVQIDEVNLTIDLKRGANSAVPHPAALISFDIVGSNAQRDSLLRMGSWVTENGIDASGPYRAARNLLLRRPPSFLTASLESVTDEQGHLTSAAKEMMSRLANEPCVLPVQGPPGSGKTFTGARMIVELISQGYRVGVAALSHKVISNLLSEVCKVARQNNVPVQAVQKPDATDGCVDPLVKLVDNNQAVRDALDTGATNVVAGTTWLWARTEMASSVDVLLIDEAGQMSLADVLAASQAARSLVLLGDPQQLDQPQQGIQPPGADGSAFDHLLRGHATIGAGQGLFLAETHRLHPDICEFTSEVFYEGRLKPRPENQRQRINTEGPLNGTGLRLVRVAHTGNQSESKEEVTQISALISDLLAKNTTWTDKKGETQELALTDILVVAPYNAQVAALREQLPDGARVGTVDKFQGQEAPIVFYSMTTSSPEDAPRGMEFLYSLNRLNVAISRARCISVIVASPSLFQVECRSPCQIELANAFCRYLEFLQR